MRKKFMDNKNLLLGLFLLFFTNLSIAQMPEFVWVEQVGSVRADGGDNGKSVTVDKEGNVYTVGEFWDTVKIMVGNNVETLMSSGREDIFITKQDPTGKFLWAKSFGGSGSDGVNSIAVDNKGYVYVTGSYNGTADFDPGTNKEERTATPNSRGNPGVDFYISKFDVQGNFVWVKVGGNAGSDKGTGIAFDHYSDDIYFTGQFGGGYLSIDFGQGVINLRNSGNTGSFILRMKSDGSIVWAKALGDLPASGVSANAIAVDLEGNVYTTGSYSGTADFNPDTTASFPLTPVAKGDAFVSKLDSLGNFVWAKSMGGDEQEEGFSIAVDENSNVYFTGSFQTTANFDPNGSYFLFTLGGRDVFISKLDKDGNLVWAKNVGSRTDDVGYGIDLDELGNVYTTGWFQSPSSDFNPGTNPEDTFNLVSYGSLDGFILKLNNDGEFVWAMNVGSNAGSEESRSIAVADGYVYTTGTFNRTADFDPAGPNLNQMTSHGGSDVFILKLKDCILISETASTIAGEDSICIGNEYVYSVPYIPGVIGYQWVLPEDWQGESDSGSIKVIPNGYGTISVILMGVCDSAIVDLNVELAMNPVEITVQEMKLSTTNSSEYVSWQWYLQGEPIDGATDSFYIVTVNGNYSVVVTGKQGCVDTASYEVTNATSIENAAEMADLIRIYPNPASDILNVNVPVPLTVSITSIDGSSIHTMKLENKSSVINISLLNQGIYFIRFMDMNGQLIKVDKLLKVK